MVREGGKGTDLFAENQPWAILAAPRGGGGFGEPRAVVGEVWAWPYEGPGAMSPISRPPHPEIQP